MLAGYNGAGNTGSDLRTLQIIEDLEQSQGNDIAVSVISLHRGWRELCEGKQHVRVLQARLVLVPLQTVWWILRHDVVLLAEGSTFKVSWSSLLLWAYLWMAFISICLRRPCIAYCVDVGDLSPLQRRIVVWICNRLTTVIVRSHAARQRLDTWGVRREIHVSADPVLRYPARASALKGTCRNDVKRIGIAPIEFHQWPVRIRPFGPRRLCYRWPLYFSWDRTRQMRSSVAIRHFGTLCRYILNHCDCHLTLIAMEPVDDHVCSLIRDQLPPADRSRLRILTRKSESCADLLGFLRNLDFLITARYHASIVALPAAVPQIAVYHDERLEALFGEMGLQKHCAIRFDEPDLANAILSKLTWCFENRAAVQQHIRKQYDEILVFSSAKAVDILRTAIANRKATVAANGMPSFPEELR